MDTPFFAYVPLTILVINSILLIWLILRKRNNEIADLVAKVAQFHQLHSHEITSLSREFSILLKSQFGSIGDKISDNTDYQVKALMSFQNQLNHLMQNSDQRLKDMHDTTLKALHHSKREIRESVDTMRKENGIHMEKMRLTVDEKLHATLENRLGQSFKLVNDSLEKVQKGLGEMKHLANGVGDLKKVLSNVKTRGMLGEIQLGNILEQILSPDQYALNVATIPNSHNHVEFAIRMPGKDDTSHEVWLPIDSKFPMDRYEVVLSAYETGDVEEVQNAIKSLMQTVRGMSKDIRNKYISPPHTTEFGILFLPVEGLYAEVVRHTELVEELQRQHKIMLAGPTNLAAFLNSIQMGFQSIAIERRSSEVWKILGEVKTEFGKFGDVLAKTQKKILEASNVIDKAGVRTRAIQRKLRNVQELPQSTSLNEA